MPYQTIGKYASRSGVSRKTDFKRPVTFFDRVRFVGGTSTMEILGGVLSGDISADLITLGTLSVDRIASGTITASKLVVGSAGNLVQDPSFETTDTLSLIHASFANGGAWGTGSSTRSGGTSINYDATGQTSNAAVYLNAADGNGIVHHPAVHLGEQIYLSVYARGFASGPWNKAAVIISWRDEDANITGSDAGAWTTMTGSYKKLEVSGVAPAGTTHCILQLWVEDNGIANDLIIFDDCYAHRMVGTVIIEDGAITAEKITVTSLDAITATMGALTINDTLTMETGGVFRTAASGARIQISESIFDTLFFYTGGYQESNGAAIQGSFAGTGSSGNLELGFFSPVESGQGQQLRYAMRTESANGTSRRPEFYFSLFGSQTLYGLFTIQNNFRVRVGAGLVGTPILSFYGDTDTGMYWYGANQIGFAAGGVVKLRVGAGHHYIDTTVTDIRFQGVNSFDTTGTGANLYCRTSSQIGKLRRFTSARKYKSRINYNVDYLADIELKPTKHYRKDDKRWFYSFIADDLADEDKLLGTFDEHGEIEAFDQYAIMAVLAAKINRLEARLDNQEQI